MILRNSLELKNLGFRRLGSLVEVEVVILDRRGF